MVGKPGARRRRGQTRLLAGLCAVAVGLTWFYLRREGSAGAQEQAQQQRLLLPLEDGLHGAAVTAGNKIADAVDPATFASATGDAQAASADERRLATGGDVALSAAAVAEEKPSGLLFSADEPVKLDSSATTAAVLTTIIRASADAAATGATSAGADEKHKFLDGVMGEAADARAAVLGAGALAAAGAHAGFGTGSAAAATDARQQIGALDDTGDVIGIGVAKKVVIVGTGTAAKAATAAATAATALVDKAEAVAGSAAPEAKPLGLYFKEDVREEAKKRGGAVAHRQAIARLRAAGAADGVVNETKPLGFYFGLNANEKDQAGLTAGGKDDSQGVAAGIAQKAAAQLTERGSEVRLFSLARRSSRRSFRRRSRMLLGGS